MASFYDKVSSANEQSLPPVVAKLEGVFNALEDGELLKALKGKVHRGCQGYSVEALWHSYLASYVLNIPTVASLIRAFENNPALCRACGLDPHAIPSEATYSRFVARLTKHTTLVEQAMKNGVEILREHLPRFGEIVAIDSSDIKAYSNSRRPSDHDARLSKKRRHSVDYWWFGYKVHILSDAESELPLHVEVTPANVNDAPTLVPMLQHSKLSPRFVLADAGYDSIENYRYVHDDLGAFPIIS